MAEPRKGHIVMFPFMAQGHIIPFLALALEIEQKKGCKITFITTPSNVKKLRSSLSPTSSIQLLEIYYSPSEHGLPPGTENTDSLHYDIILKFIISTISLKPTFKELLSDLVRKDKDNPPTCVVTDMFFAWTTEVAHEFGMISMLFIAGCAFGFACFYSLWLHLPHRDTVDDEFLLPDFPEASKIHITQMADFQRTADHDFPYAVFLRKMLPEWWNCDGILLNSVQELDNLGLVFFRRKFDKPIWEVGPILLSSGNSRDGVGKESSIMSEVCKNWLDTKPANSVLYVSFGSQNTISAQHIRQLALALEHSGKNFIWVVRPPLGFDINSEFNSKEWLPSGFEERMEESKRGLLVHKWAPQVEILSHKSVGVFLSHCGWNSVLESLGYGVPLVSWPMAAEQFYNVKLLAEEVGVCVEVARGKSCEVKYEDIVEKIELVMSGESEKAKDMRTKACQVKHLIKEATRKEDGFMGSSVKAMEEFLDAALQIKKHENCVSDYGKN